MLSGASTRSLSGGSAPWRPSSSGTISCLLSRSYRPRRPPPRSSRRWSVAIPLGELQQWLRTLITDSRGAAIALRETEQPRLSALVDDGRVPLLARVATY